MEIHLPNNVRITDFTLRGARKFRNETNKKNQHTCEESTTLKPDSIKIAPSLYAAEAGTRLRKAKEEDKVLRSCTQSRGTEQRWSRADGYSIAPVQCSLV